MVFHNSRHSEISNLDYSNAEWRARKGYKEEHVHDPAGRRNRDFKPVPYGTYRGMPNYRHSEPFALLKNMKDIHYEEHNHCIKWIRTALKGAFVGSFLGYTYFIGAPVGAFELSKLQASIGNR